MSLAPGDRLGAYEITNLLGAGGMGEVYRARDTRLDRTVAVKVLPTEFTGDSEARSRFEREARAIGALNHSHICVLHDIGRENGIDFLVMEYLEGETLAKRLERGALPWETAVLYAVQIADALDRAHRHGIVHRDLKPGNVMVTRSGVKLLDFGLAKASPAGAVAVPTALSSLPTTPHVGTASGTILGTLQYMAPEQLEGVEVDTRTDLFAFGCLLHEMLSGERAFDGKSQASLIAAILQTSPPAPSTLQVSVPASLDRIVAACLAKDPDARWQSARDLAYELTWVARGAENGKGSLPQIAAAAAVRKWQIAAAVMGMTALAGLAIGYGSGSGASSSNEAGTVRFSLPPPENVGYGTAQVGRFAISPNGMYLAFVGTSPGKTSIWIRPLDSLAARIVPGTEGAEFNPFWSPDSTRIGFYAGGRLKTIGLDGSGVQALCALPQRPGGYVQVIRGTWNASGIILFAQGMQDPLFKVSATGGTCEPVTSLDKTRSEVSHSTPQFLPDGRHFVFIVRSKQPEYAGIHVGSLEGGKPRQLVEGATNVAYSSDGYLLYVRDRELVAQRFDERTLVLVGTPRPFGENADFAVGSNFSVSTNGTLVHAPGGQGESRLTWFDRNGRQLGIVGEAHSYGNFELSSDDSRVAVSIADPATGRGSIWSIDLARSVASRLTFGEGRDNSPVWSPDGRQIAFTRTRGERTNSIMALSLANGKEAQLHDPGPLGGGQLDDWSPDGRYVTFNASPLLRAIPAEGGSPFTFVETASALLDESHFSPDGKWIAYNSNESGIWQVYVAPFPTTGERLQISQEGGAQARWTADGTELFYLTPDSRMMVVTVSVTAGHFRAGVARELFKTQIGMSPFQDQYAVTRDGQRFLIADPVVEGARHPLTVVLNWPSSLKE